MKTSTLLRVLVLIATFQILVLVGEYLFSVSPLLFGQPVTLEIVPVDPRSLFRGNYVRLNYAISTVPAHMLPEDIGPLKPGDVLYVNLEKRADIHQAKSVSRTKPDTTIFIRGRVVDIKRETKETTVRLRYGIEAYFASKDRSLAIEKSVRTRQSLAQGSSRPGTNKQAQRESTITYANIRITSGGRAALEELRWDSP